MRIRMAAAGVNGWDAAELHRRVSKLIDVHYETIRRIWADDRKGEIPYSLLKAIAETTGVSVEFVAGDSVDLPIRAKGLFRDLVTGKLENPLPELAVA